MAGDGRMRKSTDKCLVCTLWDQVASRTVREQINGCIEDSRGKNAHSVWNSETFRGTTVGTEICTIGVLARLRVVTLAASFSLFPLASVSSRVWLGVPLRPGVRLWLPRHWQLRDALEGAKALNTREPRIDHNYTEDFQEPGIDQLNGPRFWLSFCL